jgi:hypothetical protein
MSRGDGSAPSAKQLSESLLRTSRFVLFLIILLVSIGGVFAAFVLQGQGETLLSGLTAGLAASLVAYVLSDWLNDTLVQRHAQTAVDLAIKENVALGFQQAAAQQSASVESIVQSVVEKVRNIEQEGFFVLSRQFPDFLPSNVFPPSNKSNPAFTQSLTEAMRDTKEFYFKGVTARHVPIFLEKQRASAVRCTVLILDPRLEQEIWLYSQNRYATEERLHERRPELIARVRREIFAAIVALWDARDICPITVKLHRGPVFYRIEMFDDRSLVSFYVGSERSIYPVSYEYRSASFYYKAFRRDVHDSFQLATSSLDMSGSAEEKLASFLAEIGCTESVEVLRSEHKAFRDSLEGASG